MALFQQYKAAVEAGMAAAAEDDRVGDEQEEKGKREGQIAPTKPFQSKAETLEKEGARETGQQHRRLALLKAAVKRGLAAHAANKVATERNRTPESLKHLREESLPAHVAAAAGERCEAGAGERHVAAEMTAGTSAAERIRCCARGRSTEVLRGSAQESASSRNHEAVGEEREFFHARNMRLEQKEATCYENEEKEKSNTSFTGEDVISNKHTSFVSLLKNEQGKGNENFHEGKGKRRDVAEAVVEQSASALKEEKEMTGRTPQMSTRDRIATASWRSPKKTQKGDVVFPCDWRLSRAATASWGSKAVEEGDIPDIKSSALEREGRKVDEQRRRESEGTGHVRDEEGAFFPPRSLSSSSVQRTEEKKNRKSEEVRGDEVRDEEGRGEIPARTKREELREKCDGLHDQRETSGRRRGSTGGREDKKKVEGKGLDGDMRKEHLFEMTVEEKEENREENVHRSDFSISRQLEDREQGKKGQTERSPDTFGFSSNNKKVEENEPQRGKRKRKFGAGAALFSVMNASLSEGVNFTGELARLLVVVGLPYPSPTDPVFALRAAHFTFLQQQQREQEGKDEKENHAQPHYSVFQQRQARRSEQALPLQQPSDRHQCQQPARKESRGVNRGQQQQQTPLSGQNCCELQPPVQREGSLALRQAPYEGVKAARGRSAEKGRDGTETAGEGTEEARRGKEDSGGCHNYLPSGTGNSSGHRERRDSISGWKREWSGRANTEEETSLAMLQCLMVVNQTIGRAIRHKDDYAAILLVDHRFTHARIYQLLSRWIRESLQSTAALYGTPSFSPTVASFALRNDKPLCYTDAREVAGTIRNFFTRLRNSTENKRTVLSKDLQ